MTYGADEPLDRDYAQWFLTLDNEKQQLIIRQLKRVQRETREECARVAEERLVGRDAILGAYVATAIRARK
jgi:hypothetical protein